MKTKFSTHDLISAVGALILVITLYTCRSYRPDVDASQDDLTSLKADLSFLRTEMLMLGIQVPAEEDFAELVTKECDRLQVMFDAAFNKPTVGSIDYILQIHANSYMDPSLLDRDSERSAKIVSDSILEGNYDIVAFEGSAFDGFSTNVQTKEIHARLLFRQNSPLYKSLIEKGLDPKNFEQVRPYLFGVSLIDKNSQRWVDLEKKTGSIFVAGESLPFTVLMGKLESNEISHPHRKVIIDSIQRIRSAYALAATIKQLQDRSQSRAAIVFGFSHKGDFEQLARSFKIPGEIIDATGKKDP